MTENTPQAAECLSHLTAELDTISDEKVKEKGTLRGFGITFDCVTGRSRQWYCKDGITRWTDNDQICKVSSDGLTAISLEYGNHFCV